MLNDQGGWSKPMMPEVATTANKERGLFIDHITHHTTHQPQSMAEPTKQETEQVFKVLKAQKANKVTDLALQPNYGKKKRNLTIKNYKK